MIYSIEYSLILLKIELITNIKSKSIMFKQTNRYKDGMECLTVKKCKESGCKIRPTFGLPGKKAEYCSSHKKEGMMSNPNRTCLHKSCKEIAIYGIGKATDYF